MFAPMASTKPIPLTRAELKFWESAFLTAQLTALLKGNGRRINPAGAAHLASEYASAAVLERRRVKNGGAR